MGPTPLCLGGSGALSALHALACFSLSPGYHQESASVDLLHRGSCLVTSENGQSCGQLFTSHPVTTLTVSGNTQCGFAKIYVPSPYAETLYLKQERKLLMSLTILPCPTCSPSH